jgi:uncharacterized protein YrzB (UPF0473 family)
MSKFKEVSKFKELPLLGTDKHMLIEALNEMGSEAVSADGPVFKIPDGPVVTVYARKYSPETHTLLALCDEMRSLQLGYKAKFWILAVDHDHRIVRFAMTDDFGNDLFHKKEEKPEPATPVSETPDETDDTIVYRAIRAPERRVFYVDVGNMAPEEEAKHLETIKMELKKKGYERELAAFRNESDNQFSDISSEASRTYNFGQKGFVKIQNPLYLAVSPSGGHRIFSADGQSHYIPQGWIHLAWTVHEGQPNFVK